MSLAKFSKNKERETTSPAFEGGCKIHFMVQTLYRVAEDPKIISTTRRLVGFLKQFAIDSSAEDLTLPFLAFSFSMYRD